MCVMMCGVDFKFDVGENGSMYLCTRGCMWVCVMWIWAVREITKNQNVMLIMNWSCTDSDSGYFFMLFNQ
jgi:hypothetical protein